LRIEWGATAAWQISTPRPAGFRIPAHTHIAMTADYAKALADSLQQMIAKASPPAKE